LTCDGPFSCGDRFDAALFGDESVPGRAAGLDDGLIVFEDMGTSVQVIEDHYGHLKPEMVGDELTVE
jgi:hypothetical protein